MTLISYLMNREPRLRSELYKARMHITPEQFIAKAVRVSLMVSITVGVLLFFYVAKSGAPFWIPVLAALFFLFATYWYTLRTPQLAQMKVAADIDREVLFAGRFLLVKLNSGKPLVTALMEASRSYGVSNKYFLEIVRDIELGTPLEAAIEKAMVNSPSEHWRKILFQIHNALRLGIDVSTSLESVLDDISHDYLLQIQRYGKKLSTFTLFYLLLAVVVPSLGMTILIVIISFAGIQLTTGLFVAILVVLAFVQIIFMNLFNSIRPKVNL
jgi:pilus assembly protein TadC